jgi:hypothetical protein
MEDKWKNNLLKSGLPFEYEIKECFVKYSCTVWDEYSYIKADENKIEKEFSYDLDANYWPGGHSVDFMIECKYKTEPTKWFFTPDPYGYQNDLNQNSFMHVMDYFSGNQFPFRHIPYDKVIEKPLGPFCLKGVEIYRDSSLEVNITKAIHQLSYAFVEKLISSMSSQLDTEVEMFHKTNFIHVPVIITNADLYLINENLTTKNIKSAKLIDDISTKHDFLLFHNKIGEDLKNHNYHRLASFLLSKSEQFKERNTSFAEDIEHFIDVLASRLCPECILIMHHDDDHANYKKLFDYINFIMLPSDKRNKRMKYVQKRMTDKHNKMMKQIKKSRK